MSKSIENCPVEEKPIRERAYTDRQLLELAAKAYGLRIDKSPYNGGGAGNTGFDVCGNVVLDWHNGKTWNPLTDDGDALRLAVKLRISLEMDETYVFGLRTRYSESGMCECWNNDPCAAARRAIVRVAAAIAEGAKS